jgi:hypothetical protein
MEAMTPERVDTLRRILLEEFPRQFLWNSWRQSHEKEVTDYLRAYPALPLPLAWPAERLMLHHAAIQRAFQGTMMLRFLQEYIPQSDDPREMALQAARLFEMTGSIYHSGEWFYHPVPSPWI